MNLNIVIATADLQLNRAISSRVLHPAVGMNLLGVVEDAVELIALLNSAEVDLVIIDANLPRLEKNLVKLIVQKADLLAIKTNDNSQLRKLGLNRSAIDLADLAADLGRLKPTTLELHSNVAQGQIVAIAATASGSGASAVAISMAQFRSVLESVCLVDFDLTHPSLAVQLNQHSITAGLLQLTQQLQYAPLTAAELAQRCIQITPALRLLPGLAAANQLIDLDLNVMDEVICAASELDQLVVIDLGQLQQLGAIAKFQQQVIASSAKLILVTAADPISMLTTCNWLAKNAANYKNKLQIIVNKTTARTANHELSKLIAESSTIAPAAFLVADAKLFEQAIWSGEAAVALRPRSKFSQAVASWLQLTKTNTEVIPIKPGKQRGLKRLQQAS
jgi:Mrp family chromosome partitioning ATPase